MERKVSQFLIYALHHSLSKHMYIGKSSSGFRRPQEHGWPKAMERYAELPRTKWIKSLRKRGLDYQIAVIEELSRKEDLNEAERFHIAYMRSIGVALLNLTDGGDGFTGQHTDEARAKMSAKNKWRGNSKRMGEVARGYWKKPEAREKKRQERLGTTWSAEVRAKQSAAHKGKPKTKEHRQKLSVAATTRMKLRWQDPAYRAEQIEIQRRVRAQKSEAVRKLWQDPEYRERILSKRKEKDPL